MPEDIILDVRCLGCGEPVSPAEVDWDIFRNRGIAVHKKDECYKKLELHLYENRQWYGIPEESFSEEVRHPQT